MHTKFRLESQKARDHLENIGIDGNNVKIDTTETGERGWT